MDRIPTDRKAWIWEMMHLDSVGKLCYLGDMLSRGEGANLASVVRMHCAWGKV